MSFLDKPSRFEADNFVVVLLQSVFSDEPKSGVLLQQPPTHSPQLSSGLAVSALPAKVLLVAGASPYHCSYPVTKQASRNC